MGGNMTVQSKLGEGSVKVNEWIAVHFWQARFLLQFPSEPVQRSIDHA
jgi:hypothetical protein